MLIGHAHLADPIACPCVGHDRRDAHPGPEASGGSRQAILEAATELFYRDGIRAATMDAIAARAGLTKRTLYHHFRSKDDLVAACLARLADAEQDRFIRLLAESTGPIRDRVRRLFATLAREVRDPRWKGCCFARAAGELAGLPGHPGLVAARTHRKAIEARIANLLAGEAPREAGTLARRIVLLLDGAIVQGFLHHDPAYVLDAGEIAAGLLSAPKIV
jgi:AcrR family transcriptional regulator